jgi:hypothetical protein
VTGAYVGLAKLNYSTVMLTRTRGKDRHRRKWAPLGHGLEGEVHKPPALPPEPHLYSNPNPSSPSLGLGGHRYWVAYSTEHRARFQPDSLPDLRQNKKLIVRFPTFSISSLIR